MPLLPEPLRTLGTDGKVLFWGRALRLMASGCVSVVYLAEIGLSPPVIGAVFTGRGRNALDALGHAQAAA